MNKTRAIRNLLDEMKDERLQKIGFTDLLLTGVIKNEYQEDTERTGSIDGWKSIITEKRDKKAIVTFKERYNKIDLAKTKVVQEILHITYENGKQVAININNLTGANIMKEGDNRVY